MTKIAAKKGRRKIWVDLIAPKIFREVSLGQTFVYDSQEALSKKIAQNLMNIIGDVKKQNVIVKFGVVNVQGTKAFTDVVGYSLVATSVKRLVRRKTEKIEASFVVTTSDGRCIRIKPLAITKNLVKSSVRAAVKKSMVELIARRVTKSSYDDLIIDIVSGNLQRETKKVLSKVYPIKIMEIRQLVQSKEEKKKIHFAPEQPKKAVEEEKEAVPEEPKKKEYYSKEQVTEDSSEETDE